MSRDAFQSLKNMSYDSIGGNLLVELFKIYELTEIVRQSSDPQLAHIFNTIREGNHTEDDVRETKSLAKNRIKKICHFHICKCFSKGYRDLWIVLIIKPMKQVIAR